MPITGAGEPGRADVSAFTAPLILVAARIRRRPGHWLLPAAGLALATGFAGAVAAEGTIAGDQAARSALARLSPLDRTVRVTSQGLVTAAIERRATALIQSLRLGAQTEVVLLNPVRLGGLVVRPAAVAPLARWAKAVGARAVGPPGACRPTDCPMLLAGGAVRAATLNAPGVRVTVAGAARIDSAVPLGFTPTAPSDQPPVLVSGDAAGLDALGGLSGIYRTHSWLAPLRTAALHSWQLAATEARLLEAQARLLTAGSQFSLTAPFDGLAAARAQASAAHRRLLLAGGGALAALGLFIVLAAGGLRRDQAADVERLRTAGARAGQCVLFVVAESTCLCGVAVVAGAGLAVLATALLAGTVGAPVGGVLAHSLITPLAAAALLGGWACATALLAVFLLVPGARIASPLAAAAAAALALALTRGSAGDDPLPVLLAPLCCLAAGVLTFRVAAALLRAGERLARSGPVLIRLAFVGLARAPAAPALAIAFIAVSTGLGGFALAYRATLLRGAADQAADRVPLDVRVSPGADFRSPLQDATPARWRSIAGGLVLPVRRTEASFVSGSSTVTVPALGVPADGLARLHGWRASDGSAPPAVLARRLVTPGPARTPGPFLPASTRWLSLRLSAPAMAVRVTADLRDRNGAIDQVVLGDATPHAGIVRARLPRAGLELQALELREPAGLETTNGHQNGENNAAATQLATTVTLGPLIAEDASGRPVLAAHIGSWRAVGAASIRTRDAGAGGGVTRVRFASSGLPGLLRPAQPSDLDPVAVLADPRTASAAARGGRIALTVGDVPVAARVVGVLDRFPTAAGNGAGFIVADEATLASALDAAAPGLGRADELWLAPTHTGRLRAALQQGAFARLGAAFRSDIERQLRTDPIARGVLGTLIAATLLSGALAIVGLLVALIGAGRDERVELDLIGQGAGPRGLRSELRVRLVLASLLGISIGVGVGALLTRLAVATVRAAGAAPAPRPSLVTAAPWTELALWALTVILALAAVSWLATRAVVARGTAA